MSLRRATIRVLALCLAVLPFAAMAGSGPELGEPLFPESSPESPEVTYEYRQIAPQSLSYVNGKITAQWDPRRYRVSEVVVAADLRMADPYVPGRARSLVIDDQKRRYDLVGWMIDRETGERVRFITPVWTAAAVEPESEEAASSDWPLACSLNEDVQCPDGTTVRVSCSGDTGSCSSCSTTYTACCRSSSSRKDRLPGGVGREIVTITEESQSCPKPVKPTPLPNDWPPSVRGLR